MPINICSKPRTISELATYYNVDVRTFRKWLKVPTLSSIRPEAGRFYSIRQVKIIVGHLGDNEN